MMRMTLRSRRVDAHQPAAPPTNQPAARGHPARQRVARGLPARQPSARKPRRAEATSSEALTHSQREPSNARHPPVPATPPPSSQSVSSEGSVISQREPSNASLHQPIMCHACGQQMPNPAQQPPVRITMGTATARNSTGRNQGVDKRRGRGRGPARRPNGAGNNQGVDKRRGRGPNRRPNDAGNNQGVDRHRGRGSAQRRAITV